MNSNQKGQSAIGYILIAFLLAGMTGIAVYFWQKTLVNQDTSKVENTLKNEITSLKKTIEQKDGEIDKIKKEKKEEANDLKLPIVVYEAEGSFKDIEKTNLESKVINPFFDYHNEKNLDYLVMIISKTEVTSAYMYEIMAINKNSGTQGFLFGTKSKPLPWWQPECMGKCDLTETFKNKYPDILKEIEKSNEVKAP